MSELRGKVAIVTGASRGIGAAAAQILAEQGVSVMLAARTAAEIDTNARAIRDAGCKAEAMTCDVGNYSQVSALVERCKASFGSVDILVNNAGIIDPVSLIGESDPEAWGKVVQINLMGVYHGIRAVLPEMEAQKGGVIVNISSGAATSILEGWSHYCSTKAAVLMLTRAVHKEYAGKGIRSVGLSPGTVATDMQKVIKQSGVNPVSLLNWEDHIPAEWAGRAVAYLCTSAASDLDGGDFALRPEEAKRRVGLIE